MIGATISHYKILEKLGGGGMGVVYKAEDTKLKRLVALKFLPPDLTSDIKARERFAHEAQAASSLEHPHICTVHDIGETEEGQTFIVMSFYEGETLRRKLTRGCLKVEQALEMAAQIADGLACAHDHGIVHRDIKPANIMVLNDGTVKVLDFGLAKLAGETRLTKSGATVGTLMYMAPEQVQAQETDSRSDIWALGAILQEMITGAPPFRAEHEAALLYEIVSAEPAAITDTLPDAEPELLQLVSKCLEKIPEERYQSAKDVSVDCRRLKRDIKTIRQLSASFTRGEGPASGSRYRVPARAKMHPRMFWWVLLAVFCCGALAVAIWLYRASRMNELIVTRTNLVPPLDTRFRFDGKKAGPVAISPDGLRVAFVATERNGRSALWVRMMSGMQPVKLSGTEGASYPFWSPDGKSIGFFCMGGLRTIDVESGTISFICSASYGGGGSWNKNGVIIFGYGTAHPISRVSARGGRAEPTPVTAIDTTKEEIYHHYPYFLPDGDHFLFLARTKFTSAMPIPDTVYVSSLQNGGRKSVLVGTTNVAFSNGHLLYQKEGMLIAAPFDLGDFTLGEPIPLAEKIQTNADDGGGVFTVSDAGLLIYQEQSSQSGSRLAVFDRTGKEIEQIGGLGMYWDVRFSPDGKKLAVSEADTATDNIDIWIHDPSRQSRKTRLTYSPAKERLPVWSPDGTEIVYMSDIRRDYADLYQRSVIGGSRERVFFSSQESKQPFDWSNDGKYFTYITTIDRVVRSDIWLIDLAQKSKPMVFAKTKSNEWCPRFSPDGKWIAYTSDESGQDEIYVSRFPGTLDPIPISKTGDDLGGSRPRWARGGKEIFFLDSRKVLRVAELSYSKAKIEVMAIHDLFQTYALTYSGCYDISADGQRIVINSKSEDQVSPPVVVVSNWTALLQK
jgi:Tol biopolymer transport system component/tRNA A-37 threonylcarbamoyl transferase component Bud32